MASSPQKLGERQGKDPLSEPSEGTNSADTLILDLWPPELRNYNFMFIATKFVVIYHDNARKLTELRC